MTPRTRTNIEILALIVGVCTALGGMFVYSASIISDNNVTKNRVDTIEKKLERIENKIDMLVEGTLAKKGK